MVKWKTKNKKKWESQCSTLKSGDPGTISVEVWGLLLLFSYQNNSTSWDWKRDMYPLTFPIYHFPWVRKQNGYLIRKKTWKEIDFLTRIVWSLIDRFKFHLYDHWFGFVDLTATTKGTIKGPSPFTMNYIIR